MPRRVSSAFTASIGAILLLTAPVAGDAETLTGKVIGVTDGDTITVLVDRVPIKVRLAEIDTPERGQPWGTRAKQALSQKIFGRVVELHVGFTDIYGRTVAHVRGDGRDINREMVREGHAWVYRKWMHDQTLLDDEAHARGTGAGLWGLPEAERVPPWDWRHDHGAQSVRPGKTRRKPSEAFTCGAKRYCREMESCEEARFYLQRCGIHRLDGDDDGVPCESLCR